MKSTTARRVNTMILVVGLVGAVLPAAAMYAMTAITLIVATPVVWLAYALCWWGLLSLLRIFASFIEHSVQIGTLTILGLAVGSAAVVTLRWPVFTGAAACSTCRPPEFLVYRPELLCVAVAAHWLFLHHRGFRLTDH